MPFQDFSAQKPKTLPKPIIIALFIIGVISAFSFRLLIVVKHFNPDLVSVVWYIGVIGYICFFLYRYMIARKRRRIVKEYALLEKLKRPEALSKEDREAVTYLLSSLNKSLEKYNYAIIFALSLIAIILDIILTLTLN